MTKEEKFYKALEDLFIGAKSEGEGGFVNLMRIKSLYYSKIREHLEKDIEKALEKYPKFREELFDKLYSFFSRYFTKSGSIYFNYTPFFKNNNVYDKVYTADKDVILFWKTKMLYYVKTDISIPKNLKIEIEDKNETYQFFFDVSNLEYKKANEKRSLVYQFKKISSDGTIFFDVFYSEKGRQTKYDEIKKSLKQKGIKITDEILDKAFSTFEAQSEVDYFINKNAKEFLQEQFKIWLYQYIYSEETEWPKERIDQLQILKDIAFKIIDFIYQFEDELVKIWEKPKFVLNSNYVITLDRIAKKNGFEIIEKIQKHKNFKEQIKEWKELGILEKDPDNLLEKTLTGLQLKKEYQFLPIDTKYFKDLGLEILSLFDDLDHSLDGWLIKSENYQALNTILEKHKENIKTIYIDPPYNTGNDGFLYKDRYQHSTWLSMMENRLSLAKELMRDDGVIFVSIDDREQENLKTLMKAIFGDDKFLAQIIRDIPDGTNLRTIGGIKTSTEYVISFLKEKEPAVNNFLFKDPIYLEIVRNEISDFIETRLTNRGNPLSEILFPKGIGKFKEDLNLVVNEGSYINPSSREKILVKKGDLVIKDGILQEDVLLEASWRMPNVLKELFAGREVYDDSGQKYEYVFFKNNGIPYIVKSRGKTLIPSYLEIRNKTDKLFVDIFGYEESPKGATIKPVELIYLLVSFYTNKNGVVLDFFAGSGTTVHAVMKLNKEDGGKRKFILVEMADYFDTIIIPRIKKIAYSFNWKDGKPQDTDGIGGFFKYQILEQYEDTLDNIELKENSQAQLNFGDDYLLKYFLDFETKDSPYLLNIEELKNPFAYKLKVNLSEVGESQEVVVDIPETFNYLLGIKLKKIKKRKNNGKDYLFILGEKEGQTYAIVWRELSNNEEEAKKDKEFIREELKDWKPQIVYTNCPNNTILTPDFGHFQAEIRYIEPEFKKLMEV